MSVTEEFGFRQEHRKRALPVFAALLFLVLVWLVLNQKLLLGDEWISATYDTPDWRTNEGNLPTYGAWDIETHIWKTQYIIEHFPNFQWNPYWYLGMPLFEYYQPGFYVLNWLLIALTGMSAARSALVLVLFGHLAATFLTFWVCYRVSGKALVSALCATFILANTFISLRSYGWEPITVVFLFLYPLGLYFFLKEPLRPFRFSIIAILAASYVSHPLIFFSLAMFMGLYLLAIAVRSQRNAQNTRYLWGYAAALGASLLLGAVQFFPQITYAQATSGAHMGVSYLPYFHVPFNIISLKDFFFDAGNLKGPGPIIMIATLLFAIFAYRDFKSRKKQLRTLLDDHLIAGSALVLFVMVLFYYLQLHDIFPMNILRSIQYHRIIPEFMITAAVLIAALSNIAVTFRARAVYHSLLIAFVIASGIIIYNVQEYWQTSDTIADSPEFITEELAGRISFPYTDQSLAVRSSFTRQHQTYGYYEQGITNPYVDELFSVSSGFHNSYLAVLYLKAANVQRLYVNANEGFRDQIMMARMNETLELVRDGNERYGYYEIALADPGYAQAVDYQKAQQVQQNATGCRVIFKERYCGSFREEFVSSDATEIAYLESYVALLEEPYAASASLEMQDPDHYIISVRNATAQTAVVVKMTYDKNFEARLAGKELGIEPVGPHFMLIHPGQAGDFDVALTYTTSTARLAGIAVSIATLLALAIIFIARPKILGRADFPRGDLQ